MTRFHYSMAAALLALLLFSQSEGQVATLTLETEPMTAEEALDSWVFEDSDAEPKCTICPETPARMASHESTIGLVGMIEDEPPSCTKSSCTKAMPLAIGVPLPNAMAMSCEDCQMCNTSKGNEFHSQLAKLLSEALKDRDLSEASSQKIIESCLAMASRNSQMESVAQMSSMQVDYERQIAEMRREMTQMSAQLGAMGELKNWLGPIYSNQNRAMHQMQMMTQSSGTLNRILAMLEKQMSTKQMANSKPVKFTNPHVYQDPREAEVYSLRRQLTELKEQMNQMRPQNVAPAHHLQPIFDSKQPEPLDIPWPFKDTVPYSVGPEMRR